MTITIYFEADKKCRQILKPVYPLKGVKVADIVSTITRGNYHSFDIS